ncbi:MAG: CDP-glucose 4,6-dehydratase [Solirubrobacteraceae bacterium]|nr:CDP-glucose 4,6-dehydratase [Solirubrobacteraceae bacterium]
MGVGRGSLEGLGGLSPRVPRRVSAISDTFWTGRRVLVTGHSGFKGRWLSLWLRSLGAEVVGFSRRRSEDAEVESIQGTVADHAAVHAAVEAARPEIVFHMAGLATVQIGLEDPVLTFTVNAIGTANVLQAVRDTGHARAVVSVTTDKVYLDRGSEWGYREDDRLGGSDPYSSSKVCQEHVTAAFRDSLLADRGIAVATARAGNVIGGGDRTAGRLVPDLIRAGLDGTPLQVRAPDAVRPWQHVLNPLYGYILLAERLWADSGCATAWNFGPDREDSYPVEWLVERMRARWPGDLAVEIAERRPILESAVPRVDSTRARTRLGWHPPWDLPAAIDATVDWHVAHRDGRDPFAISLEQIERFSAEASRPLGEQADSLA